MALAYRTGGSNESCHTNRKLFILPLSYRYVTLTHPKRIVLVKVLQRWPIESELNTNGEIVQWREQMNGQTAPSDYCGTGAFAAPRRRSASLGCKPTTQLWQREAGLCICSVFAQTIWNGWEMELLLPPPLYSSEARKQEDDAALGIYEETQTVVGCLHAFRLPVLLGLSWSGQRAGQVFTMLTQTTNLLSVKSAASPACVTAKHSSLTLRENWTSRNISN